jgi:hypothetical protein
MSLQEAKKLCPNRIIVNRDLILFELERAIKAIRTGEDTIMDSGDEVETIDTVN